MKLALRATLLFGLSMPLPALAQANIPAEPENMSLAQLQGVACIVTGLVAATGAVMYSGSLAAAAIAADWTIPLLFIPAAAGGYAVGCSVGSITGPGVHWLYRRYLAGP